MTFLLKTIDTVPLSFYMIYRWNLFMIYFSIWKQQMKLIKRRILNLELIHLLVNKNYFQIYKSMINWTAFLFFSEKYKAVLDFFSFSRAVLDFFSFSRMKTMVLKGPTRTLLFRMRHRLEFNIKQRSTSNN